MDQRDAIRRGVAEAIGAGALMFFGAGAIVVQAATGEGSLLVVALAHGLAIALAVTWLGHISGGHFNPAITFAFLVTRRIDSVMAVVYWIGQLVGAVIAALLLRAVFDDRLVDAVNLGAPGLGEGVGVGEGFLVEIILTFFLVLSVFATAVDARGAFKIVAGFAIGLTITVDVLVGGPLTGAAMNPSRAFGAQLVGNFWADGWIYYLAPLVGGGLAALLYEKLYLGEQRPVPVGPPETGVDEPGLGDAARR